MKSLETTYKDPKETQTLIIQQVKMASIGTLAASVVHEMNNPMSFINSNLDRLAEYIGDFFTLIAVYQNLLSALKDTIGETGPVADHMERIRRLESEIDIDFLLHDTPNLIEESREGAERIKKIVQSLKDFTQGGTTIGVESTKSKETTFTVRIPVVGML